MLGNSSWVAWNTGKHARHILHMSEGGELDAGRRDWHWPVPAWRWGDATNECMSSFDAWARVCMCSHVCIVWAHEPTQQ